MPPNTPKITKNEKKSIFPVFHVNSPIFSEKSNFIGQNRNIENLTPYGLFFHVLGHNSGSGRNFLNLFTYLKTREKMQSHVCQQIFSI